MYVCMYYCMSYRKGAVRDPRVTAANDDIFGGYNQSGRRGGSRLEALLKKKKEEETQIIITTPGK